MNMSNTRNMKTIHVWTIVLIALAALLFFAGLVGGKPRPDAPAESNRGAVSAATQQAKLFTAEQIRAWRSRLDELAELPESTPSGWSKSRVDPAKLLTVFPDLKVRQGYVLRAYQFKEDGNANGFVWALPADAAYPAPDECPKLESHALNPPKPFDALDDLMEAIAGDDSIDSYLHASLLKRQFREFGAAWHGVQWGTHFVIDSDPWKTTRPGGADELDPMQVPQSPRHEWKWKHALPTDLSPSVVLDEKQATVRFYTYSGFDKEKIVQHTDVYRRGNYRPRSEEVIVGQSDKGWRF
jgi:hypothetical protein